MKKKSLMEHLTGIEKGLGKYKFPVLILLLGVGLMMVPAKEPREAPQKEAVEPGCSMEAQMEALLCQIKGAGEVEVLLTIQEGEAYTYQTDEHIRPEETDRETVIVSQGSGEDRPVITRTRSPVYRGAVVVCHGADIPSVKLSIVKAVQDLTGLGSDKISVIKMKEQ